MQTIEEISTLEISKYLNIMRKLLIDKGFFEHHLYSTLPYKVENTETFKVRNKMYLRYTPEPDIWSVGENYDKFFWVGSMFRDENKLSPIHKKEFTVVDYYLRNTDKNEIINLFIEILSSLEKYLDLPNLSSLHKEHISYNEFKKNTFDKNEDKFLIVSNYPKEESFYDSINEFKTATKKFEIYAIINGSEIELAVGGDLDKNLNLRRFIKNEKRYVKLEPLDKKFIGFGFGVERLIFLYSQLK